MLVTSPVSFYTSHEPNFYLFFKATVIKFYSVSLFFTTDSFKLILFYISLLFIILFPVNCGFCLQYQSFDFEASFLRYLNSTSKLRFLLEFEFKVLFPNYYSYSSSTSELGFRILIRIWIRFFYIISWRKLGF